MKMRSFSVVGLCFLLMLGLSWEVGAFDMQDLTTLKSTNKCTKCDLSKANLSGAHLKGANLTGADYVFAAIFCDTTMPDGTINNSGC